MYHDPPPLPPDLVKHAREMRKEGSEAESLLWGLLRDRQIQGVKFRRQHPYQGYILDFYCSELKLAVELDGGQHDEEGRRRYDEKRTACLQKQDIEVIRFWNNEVLRNSEGVLKEIWRIIGEKKAESPE